MPVHETTTDQYNDSQPQWGFNDDESYEEIEVDEDELLVEGEEEVLSSAGEGEGEGEDGDFGQHLVDEHNVQLWQCNFNDWPPRNSEHPFDESESTPRLSREEHKTEILPTERGTDPPPDPMQNRHSVRDPPPQPFMMPQEQPSSVRRLSKPQMMPEDQSMDQTKLAIAPTAAPTVDSTEVEIVEDSLLSYDDTGFYGGNLPETTLVRNEANELGNTSEKSTAAKNEHKWGCLEFILLLLYLVLVTGLVLCIYFSVLPRRDNAENHSPPAMAPTVNEGLHPTTPLHPYEPGVCELSDQVQPHVLSQCSCDGQITTLSDDAVARYDALATDFMVPNVYSNWPHDIVSCHPANQALVWLSTGCAVDESHLLQRYVLAYMYFATDGTEWRVRSRWITETDVCHWHGLECTPQGELLKIEMPENSLNGEVSIGHFTVDPFSNAYMS